MRETSPPNTDSYIPGDHWMICDVCGRKHRYSQMRRRYDGAWTCLEDWEERHPQEFVRSKPDKIRVPVARPDQTGGDITTGTATCGDGWTDNSNGTYTSDGTEATANVTFSTTLDATKYYEIQIRVTSDGTQGTVKGVCGGLETSAIRTGYAVKYGQISNANDPVGLIQSSNFDGTVWVKIRQAVTQDDL